MRNICTFVTTLLLFIAPITAMAQYQDFLSGDQILTEQEFDFGVEYIESRYVPFSMPSMDGIVFYGEFFSDGYILSVKIDCWGDEVGCIGPAPVDYRGGKLFIWNPAAGSYMVEDPEGSLISFDAWTFHGTVFPTITWYAGCFTATPGHPFPLIELSDECIFTKFSSALQEKTSEGPEAFDAPVPLSTY